jgi:predicted O-methyltransferase YrrM
MDLYNRGVKADLIYIDGDHRASSVMEDLVLAFKLLKPGGVMLCDDVNGWRSDRLQDTPKLAVDSFTQCYWDQINILRMPVAYQLAFKKC